MQETRFVKWYLKCTMCFNVPLVGGKMYLSMEFNWLYLNHIIFGYFIFLRLKLNIELCFGLMLANNVSSHSHYYKKLYTNLNYNLL